MLQMFGMLHTFVHVISADTGCSFLLQLPQDVLHLLLCRLPPKSLLALSTTCVVLRQKLQDESVWRQSYVNRYLWEGAARSISGREDVQVLIQTCNGTTRGWKQENLSREAMLQLVASYASSDKRYG